MNVIVSRSVRACTASIALASAALAGGGPYTIPDDVWVDDGFTRGATYSGPYSPVSMSDPFASELRGVVEDGGFDAYDGAGVIIVDQQPGGFNPLSISRRVDALPSINVYRWIDTYTNESEEPITIDVAFWTNLGSDGSEIVEFQDPFRFVSYEGGSFRGGGLPFDPVVAMMHGNNDWTVENLSLTRFGDGHPNFWLDDIMRTVRLTIEPARSVSLMFADLLAYSPQGAFGEPGLPGDITAALNGSAAHIADPSALFADLDRGLADSIINWTIPQPATLAPLVLSCLIASRRRR